MSKIKLLLDVVTDLRSLADSLQAVADAMASNESIDESHSETTAQVSTQKLEEKTVTLEQVRAVLAEKSHDGFTAEVRALLEKYGASKLSQINPSKYADLLVEAEALK
jgi:hypothetical protein